MLSDQQVVAIYMAKLALQQQSRCNALETNKAQRIKGQSVRVAGMYSVTPRTIRDIWNRQSWAYATKHLWCLEPQLNDGRTTSGPEDKVLLYLIPYYILCSRGDKF